jgi:hypothetical protein
MRSEKPQTHVLNDWRGGVVWAINGASSTIRLRAEAWATADYTVSTASLPCAVIGAPVVCQVAGAFPYSIVAIHGGAFARNFNPGSDQAGAVAKGLFYPAVIGTAEGFDDSPWWTAPEPWASRNW